MTHLNLSSRPHINTVTSLVDRLNTVRSKGYFDNKTWSLFATFTVKQKSNSYNLCPLKGIDSCIEIDLKNAL